VLLLLDRIKHILKGRRGQTLMEGIVSILVFSILVATVTMMIMVSLQFSHRAVERSEVMQANANEILSGEEGTPAATTLIWLEHYGDDGFPAETFGVDLQIVEHEGFTIFRPVP